MQSATLEAGGSFATSGKGSVTILRFVNELPGLILADSSSERDFTKEEIDAMAAQIAAEPNPLVGQPFDLLAGLPPSSNATSEGEHFPVRPEPMSEPCSLRNRVFSQLIRAAPDHPIEYMKTSSENFGGRLRDKVFLSALTCT